MRRSGQPLALRLALLTAAGVTVVLLVAGVLVNRAVSRSLEETLGAREQERVTFAVGLLEEELARDGPGAERHIQTLLRRIARAAGGRASLHDESGNVVASGGRVPADAQTETLSEPIAPAAGGGFLEITVVRPDQAFLRVFNAALLIAGALSVLAIVVIALVAANRLTGPLRGVAAAADRLGRGDLGARADGGPDRESTQLAQAFNAMAERLERSEMLRRRAASDVAHDLATPATVLESQLQAMVDGVVPGDREQLEKARSAASALSGVIVQLGELTHAESAPLLRRPEPFDAQELAREVVDALHAIARERRVRLLADPDGEPALVVADRGQVARALRNIVTNAIQHTPAEREVTVRVRHGDPVELRVTDQGTGITRDDLPHVFERFYRADRARAGQPGHSGSGIGLTIARELLVANGGVISVERTGPDGTTFLVTLPRSDGIGLHGTRT